MSKLSSFVPSGGGGEPGTISLVQLTEVQQASQGQKQFNLDVLRYRTDGQDLKVCINGVSQSPGHYTENSSNQVAFLDGLDSGDEVTFHITRSKSANPNEEETLQQEVKAFKPGMVMMWAGLESQIPQGWKLCNGEGVTTNGIAVPNLMDRMVICTGTKYHTGDTGGSATADTNMAGEHEHTVNVNQSGDHSHGITVSSATLSSSQVPSHKHHSGVRYYKSDNFTYGHVTGMGGNTSYTFTTVSDSGPYNPNTSTAGSSSGGSSSHNHTASIGQDGSHTHTASCTRSNSHNHTVSTMSPYYALAFIIKL